MKHNLKNINFELILTIISFLSIFLSTLMISLAGPANGYEISIYGAFQIYFWILIIIPFILPFIIFFFLKDNDSNYYLVLTIIGAVLSLIIFLLLPYFRGYELYGAGDVLSHLGYISRLGVSGHTTSVYPFIHILISEISVMTSASPITISFFINPLFVLIFLIGIFLLSFEYKKNIRTALFITAIATIPILGPEITRESIMPSLELFLLLPMVLYVFFKSYNTQKISLTGILVIFIFIFPFFHPETTLFLAIILLTIYILHKFFSIDRFKPVISDKILTRSNSTIILFLLVAFIFWLIGAQIFGTVIDQLASSLFENAFHGPLSSRTDAYSFKSFFDNVKFFILVYGPSFLYLTIAEILSLTVIFKVFLKKKQDNFNIILSSVFLFLCLVVPIFLLKGFIISFSAFRILKYPLFIAFIILGSYLFIRYINNKQKKKVLIPIFLIIIVVPAILSVFTAYNSPLIFGYNYQVTKEDLSGMDFLFEYRDDNKQIIEGMTISYQTRFGSYLMGNRSYKNIRSGYNEKILPPPHFGYINNTMLGQSYKNDNYFILTKLAEIYYPNTYPKYENYWRFNNEDFLKLNNDQSVNQVYNNGDLKILYVRGLNNSN